MVEFDDKLDLSKLNIFIIKKTYWGSTTQVYFAYKPSEECFLDDYMSFRIWRFCAIERKMFFFSAVSESSIENYCPIFSTVPLIDNKLIDIEITRNFARAKNHVNLEIYFSLNDQMIKQCQFLSFLYQFYNERLLI